MSKISKTYIPEKYRIFWNKNYNQILKRCGYDNSIFALLNSITTK